MDPMILCIFFIFNICFVVARETRVCDLAQENHWHKYKTCIFHTNFKNKYASLSHWFGNKNTKTAKEMGNECIQT